MPTDINHAIKKFYDSSSALWERTWGEHMHHGFYGENGKTKSNYQAQIDLIEELLRWGNVSDAKNILDVGCGIGGSSLYLAKKFNACVTGITLSPQQARRARERADAENLNDKATFEVDDILEFSSKEKFDLVWSLESAEHFSDKRKFFEKAAELLLPNGKILMATWCHRKTPPALSSAEKKHLQKIYTAYHLPYIISIDEYFELAKSTGFKNIETGDWTEDVAPFWNEVKRSALNFKTLIGILRAGVSTMKGALAMDLMIKGYKMDLLQFGVLKAEVK